MKVQNMTSKNGNKVANQFIIFDSEFTAFQSYDSIVVKTTFDESGERKVYLDKNDYDYSRTTEKYRNQFLGTTTKEIEKGIKSGKYILSDLNNGGKK